MRTNVVSIRYHTRWPVRQIGDNAFEIDLPMGVGPAVINPEFTAQYADLNDGDTNHMAIAALRSIAILKGQ